MWLTASPLIFTNTVLLFEDGIESKLASAWISWASINPKKCNK